MPKRSSVRRTSAVTLAAAVAFAGLAGSAAAAQQPDPLPLGHADLDAGSLPTRASGADKGRQAFLLKLNVRSTSKAFRAAGEGRVGKRAARAQLDTVEAAQEQVISELPARTAVIYRTHALLSGVAVTTNASNADALEAIPGVAAVYPIAPKKPSLSSSIPLQGGPAAWESAGTGSGTKIAIIDSGVDYTHADFGGAGTEQAYTDAQAITDDSWKTTKVVDGYDFVGDAYNADSYNPAINTPNPDLNPLDCGGHGTHVAGIAAGQGVKSNGAPYAGPYDTSIDYNQLRIGPGMAPEATLYAYKVFGCEGSTNIVTEAIDRAVDPDGNGDPSDHVDVINMSLGSDFGSPLDADAVASNAAVDAGVVVVASAGNGGDVTDVAGSPANANKAISVANSVDAQSVLDGAKVSIDSAPDITYGVTRAVRYDWDSNPDLTGPVVEAPASNPDACAPYTTEDFTGQVVLVKWTQGNLECGSITRGRNLRNAHAKGFILANSEETFDAGINGDTQIPGVLMVKSGADAIRTALQASKPVVVNGTTIATVKQEFPENTDKVSSSSSRGIHAAGNLKPDIAAVGDTVFSAAVGTGDQGVSETGTSMAGPTVAGLAALVRQAHPSWAPEQVKAAIMNTATDLYTDGALGGDKFAPVRVGAGRIQAAPATSSEVTAYVADDPGSVSVSFGPVEISGPTTLTKTVKVTNHGASAANYAVSYNAITQVEGTSFSVSPANLNVAAGATEEVTVKFQATGRADLDNSVDPTVGRYSVADGPRSTMAEASGRLLLTPTTGTVLRVPVYAAPRPVSDLTGGDAVALDPVTHKATVTMSGEGLGFGVNGTLDSDPTNDINSIGAAFELAATDPADVQCTQPTQEYCWNLPAERAADVRRVGVMAGDEMAYFAITVDKPWNTPAGATDVEVMLDVDGDLQPDFLLYNTRLPDTDVMIALLVNYNTGAVVDANYLNGLSGTIDTAQYDSDTMILPLWLPALEAAGIDQTNPRVNYGVGGWSGYQGAYVDLVGVDPGDGSVGLSADLFHPGLQVADNNGASIYPETNGTALQVTQDEATYEGNDSQGLMLVHLHNAVGAKSEVLDIAHAAGVTTTSLTTSPALVEVGKPTSLSVAVTGVSGRPSGEVKVVAAETGAVLATGTLDGSGQAVLSYTPKTTGSVRMVAKYAGDTKNQASNSAETVLTVTDVPVPSVTISNLSVTPASVVRGLPVTLDVVVTGSGGTPSGIVSVVDQGSGKTVASGPLADGKASLKFTPIEPGLLTLQARYAGSGAFDASASLFQALTVKAADADVSLKLSSKSGAPKEKLTATIKVARVNGIAATGKVKLTDGGDVVGKAILSNGKAEVTYKPKNSGKHVLRALYGGDATYKSGKSGKKTYTVN